MGKYFISISKDKKIDVIEKEVFGSFIEHLGRAVYNGIYEPTHKEADELGFRKDVIRSVSDLGVSVIRYPGGNFVSGYDWKKGIGPKENRPEVIDLAWIAVEPNFVGVDEFVEFAKKSNSSVLMALNLGTGSMQDVSDLVQYCNLDDQGMWAKKRIEYGHREPYSIKYWCLGNEMDGSYQIGAKSAEDYSKVAIEAAKIVKWVSPQAKTIACGSSSPFSPTFPAWDKTVVHNAFDYIDYISMHSYYTYPTEDKDEKEFFACAKNFDEYIKSGIKLIKDEKRARNSDKELFISVDEWNVWHTFDGTSQRQKDWAYGLPLLENNYDYADAVLFTSMLTVLMNHSDYVKIACLAQLVNVIAPIMTKVGGGILKQTTYYPFAYISKNFGGCVSLDTEFDLPTYSSSKYGEVSGVYHSVAYNEEKGVYEIVCVNVLDKEIEIDLGFNETVELLKHNYIKSPELHSKNTFEEPDNVLLCESDENDVPEENKTIILKKFSINFFVYKSKY